MSLQRAEDLLAAKSDGDGALFASPKSRIWGSASGHEDLAVAYFTLGRLDDAARLWRAYLATESPTLWMAADSLADTAFGQGVDLGPVAEVNKEFMSRTPVEEAALRARTSVECGDLKAGLSHLGRALQMLKNEEWPHGALSYLNLAQAMAGLGQPRGTATWWRVYLSACGEAKRDEEVGQANAYFGAIADDQAVAGVTEEFRSTRKTALLARGAWIFPVGLTRIDNSGLP